MSSESLAEIGGIADWLADYCGISTAIIGTLSLRRAIQQRLKLTGLPDVAAYQQRLQASADEQQCLVELVVVPETWFFRDRHPYSYLRNHVARRLQDGLPSQPLRLLSAPCASGEEPYSLAMTLVDLGLPSQAFSIDAIDICRQSIHKARQAVYSQHSFRGVSEAEQHRYFQRTPQGLALHPAIRAMVRFRQANLMTCLTGMAGRYDVIFCRNLLIYLQNAASEQLVASLAALLRVGGLLIVGSAETGKVPAQWFTPIRSSFVFGFLRRDPQASTPAPAPLSDGAPAHCSPPDRLRRSRSEPSAPRSRRRAALRGASGGSAPRSAALGPEALAPDRRSPLTEAQQELQRCQEELERNPSSPLAYLRLSQWLLLHKRHEEAMDCLRKCLYLKPDCREAMQALIQISQQLGQLERSRLVQARLTRLES